MPPQRRLLSAAVLACLALGCAATPAVAGEVTVVDGDRVERRQDPLVPSRAASDLARAPRLSARGTPRAGASSRRPVARSTRHRRRAMLRARRAVLRALRRARHARRISRSRYRSYLRIYRRARSVRRRLRGARGRQLGYVIYSVERLALRRRLGVTRMPASFLQLRRNASYWPSRPYPAPKDQLTFRGSEILFQYYPGRGLQIQPLSTFKRANLMYGACTGAVEAPCRPQGLRRLLNEMTRLAVRRHRRFIAWEYLFDFGGGSPPWMSGMAQATGIQALGRASRLLGEPRYLKTARKALGAFEIRPPRGVRTRGPRGGIHYLQYSFAPRLYIFNAFLQSLIGLNDFKLIAGDARAATLYAQAEPEARREVPHSDVGDWSRYSYRGRESSYEYHELLREILQSLCNRRLGEIYCGYAGRYRRYQTEPPELEYVSPELAAADRLTRVRFGLSKLSAVELTVRKGSRVTFHRIATFRRGAGSFLWRPRSAGSYRVTLAAKELRTGRGLKDRAYADVEVE